MKSHDSARKRPRDNKSSLRARYNAYSRLSTPGAIINTYRNHEIGPEEAVHALEHTVADGRNVAGEICLQQTMQAPSVDEAAKWLERADYNFRASVEARSSGQQMNGHQAKALLHLAQLGNNAIIVSTAKLPDPHKAAKAYESTLDASLQIRQDYLTAVNRNDRNLAAGLSGAIGEAAVLLLGQRYAIWSGINSSTWFMMLSWFNQDRRTSRGSPVNRSWDINGYSDHGEGIKTDYRIQVKSTDYLRRIDDADPASGITTISVRPDLQLRGERRLHVDYIIAECLGDYEGMEQASQRLDARTSLLLDKLDNPTVRLSRPTNA